MHSLENRHGSIYTKELLVILQCLKNVGFIGFFMTSKIRCQNIFDVSLIGPIKQHGEYSLTKSRRPSKFD